MHRRWPIVFIVYVTWIIQYQITSITIRYVMFTHTHFLKNLSLVTSPWLPISLCKHSSAMDRRCMHLLVIWKHSYYYMETSPKRRKKSIYSLCHTLSGLIPTFWWIHPYTHFFFFLMFVYFISHSCSKSWLLILIRLQISSLSFNSLIFFLFQWFNCNSHRN